MASPAAVNVTTVSTGIVELPVPDGKAADTVTPEPSSPSVNTLWFPFAPPSVSTVMLISSSPSSSIKYVCGNPSNPAGRLPKYITNVLTPSATLSV